jgi:agmatine/peptidylarginine deiminase
MSTIPIVTDYRTRSGSTPSIDGFEMPGEFHKHERCWMAWPYRPDIWRNDAAPVQTSFSNLVAKIAECEPVTVLVNSECWNKAETQIGSIPNVTMKKVDIDDAWVRDTGPTFVINADEIRGVDWKFNAWGGKDGGCYADWNRDDAVAAAVLDSLKVKRYRAPLILEGGSIHVDGEGTLITTEECLLDPNRNPELTRAEIENLLKSYTGAEKVIWLQYGVHGDEDTNGHVDNLCFFVRPGHVALTWTDNPQDPQHSRRYSLAAAHPVRVAPIISAGEDFESDHDSSGCKRTRASHPDSSVRAAARTLTVGSLRRRTPRAGESTSTSSISPARSWPPRLPRLPPSLRRCQCLISLAVLVLVWNDKALVNLAAAVAAAVTVAVYAGALG